MYFYSPRVARLLLYVRTRQVRPHCHGQPHLLTLTPLLCVVLSSLSTDWTCPSLLPPLPERRLRVSYPPRGMSASAFSGRRSCSRVLNGRNPPRLFCDASQILQPKLSSFLATIARCDRCGLVSECKKEIKREKLHRGARVGI